MNDHRHYLDRDVAWDQGQGKGIDREGRTSDGGHWSWFGVFA